MESQIAPQEQEQEVSTKSRIPNFFNIIEFLDYRTEKGQSKLNNFIKAKIILGFIFSLILNSLRYHNLIQTCLIFIPFFLISPILLKINQKKKNSSLIPIIYVLDPFSKIISFYPILLLIYLNLPILALLSLTFTLFSALFSFYTPKKITEWFNLNIINNPYKDKIEQIQYYLIIGIVLLTGIIQSFTDDQILIKAFYLFGAFYMTIYGLLVVFYIGLYVKDLKQAIENNTEIPPFEWNLFK